jgi:hypothetical protein
MRKIIVPRLTRLWSDSKAALRSAGRWPLIGLVLTFALIGFLQMTRGTAVRHVQGVGTDGPSVAVSQPEFLLMVACRRAGARPPVLLNGVCLAVPSSSPRLLSALPGDLNDMLVSMRAEPVVEGVSLFGAIGDVVACIMGLGLFRSIRHSEQTRGDP